jgi:hypothetical protein
MTTTENPRRSGADTGGRFTLSPAHGEGVTVDPAADVDLTAIPRFYAVHTGPNPDLGSQIARAGAIISTTFCQLVPEEGLDWPDDLKKPIISTWLGVDARRQGYRHCLTRPPLV